MKTWCDRIRQGSFWMALVVVICVAAPLRAATGRIMMVTDRADLEAGGLNLTGYLQGLGYDVTVDPGDGTGASAYRTLDAAKIAYLEGFDLVIVHRSINSGDFAESPEPTQWNSLNVPLLLGSAYLARNNPARWDWLAGSQARTQVAGLVFADPNHPIVAGLGTDLFVGARDVDYVSTTAPGHGTLVATVNGVGAALVVWDNAGYFLGASGQSHTQRRVFFPFIRYHETDSTPPNVPGVFADYTANGLALLAHVVAYAMNGTVGPSAPRILNLLPEDGTVEHPAASGISFQAVSEEPIPTGGISLVLNGADVSAQLVVSGEATNRMVAYHGLVGSTDYAGTITVSNVLGTASLSFGFDTYPPDLTAPTVTQVVPAPGTVASLTNITVTFSEPVTGVVGTDLLANGVPAYGVSGSGAVYTFSLEPSAYGTVLISWDPAAVITDLAPAGNRFDGAGPGATWQYTLVDLVPPEAMMVAPFPGATVRSLTQVSVTFSEEVRGVQASDLLINGVPAMSVSGTFTGPYLFQFSSPAAGPVQVAWAEGHGITDTATPPNALAGGAWTYILDPALELPPVRLNEILAATLSTNQFMDEDGALQDWIELHNQGTHPVNLAGWALTDDPDDPDRFMLPAVTLGPDQYLIVFASGKDRRSTTPGSWLHANFQLSSAGEYLGLYSADLPPVPVSELNYPEQRNDISYGYDAVGQPRYFATPTPGGPNGASTITGVVPPVHFSVSRGHFETPFQLYLSTSEPGATIRYTTDGSEPGPASGLVYEGSLEVAGTRVLRAAAFMENRLPSRTVTHSYLFPRQVPGQPNHPPGYPVGATVFGGYPSDYEMDPEIVTNSVYGPQVVAALQSLPSLSVVTSIDALFGPENGIYTHTSDSQTLYRGIEWERACSVEFMTPDGRGEFHADCGIRIQGNASRNPQKTPKHPFRLMFRGAYGAGRLEEEVFPDSPVRNFNTLVLRADFNNSWLHWDNNQRARGTRIRDAWTKDTWRAMGQVGGHSRFFHLYLNGLYWGVYDFGERVDAAFSASYLGGDREDYDAIASKPTEAIDGDLAAYNAMAAAVRNFDQSVLANYETVLSHLDIDNFIDYMLINFYGANQDWGNDSNWNAVHPRRPEGLIQYVVWDGEQLLVNVNDNRVSNTDVPGGLHTSLRNSPEYRLAFADRVYRHLFNGGALTPERAARRWLDRAAEVDLAVIAESARWGDYRRDVHQYQNSPYLFYTRNEFWEPEVSRLATAYFPQRHEVFLAQLRSAGLYPNLDTPEFNRHGGQVPAGFTLVMTAAGPVYYTTDGTDPRVFGTGAVAPGAVLYTGPVSLSASVVIKARAFSGGTWSALHEATFQVVELTVPVRFTEIMYNPIGGDPYEFVELQHIGSLPLDLGGYSFSGITFTVPLGTVLNPGQTMVLANSMSPAAFASRYPGVDVLGYYDGSLANGGERLALLNPEGHVAAAVIYDDQDGWPPAADGLGPSLEIVDVTGSSDDPANWQASAAANGSPGSVSPPAPVPGVRLNEIMAVNLTTVTNEGLMSDWIELHGAGPAAVDLGGWSLTDNGDPRRFVFPAGTTLQAGDYLLVWCDTNLTAAGLHTGFALKQSGESLFLYNALGERVDAVTFGSQLPDLTVGRVAEGWQLCAPTPGTANQIAPQGSASDLVINEWLADSLPGQQDWLELHNTHPTLPVSLRGLYLAIATTPYRITSLSFMAPAGYARLWADENAGPDHLGFRLPAAGGSITLSDAAGTVIDSVSYGLQLENISEGRLPDGADTITAFPGTASPGASNYAGAYAGPVLHEFMARNTSAVAGPDASYPDWVELHNATAATVDLGGMSLSDDPGQPGLWRVPAGVQIPAGGYLVIWCDGAQPGSLTAVSELNTGFSLSAAGGGLYLFNASLQQVDRVEYGAQVENLSLGLSGGQWALLSHPTPGQANAAPAPLGSPTQLSINEWMAQPPTGADWLELYNADPRPVALSDLKLTDDLSLAGALVPGIGPLTFIGGGGFVRWIADGQPSQGPDHLPFSLDGQGESIRLYAADGVVLDTVFLGPQIEGASQGRLPDGSSQVMRFDSTPTPAASNYLPLTEVVVNEVLTHTDDPLEDAVELRNLSPDAIDVSGWYLTDSAQDFQKYRLPAGSILPGDGFRVIYQQQLDGGTGSLTPFTFSSSRGESVILSEADASGQLTGHRSQFTFGPAANGVSFGRHETTLGAHFPPMARRTFGVDQPATLDQFRSGTGLANAQPRIGPVILNEVMYHPFTLPGQEEAEYIELHNVSDQTVPLYDPAYPTHTYRLRGGVEFDFPSGTSVLAHGFLLVVAFDPEADPAAQAAFRTLHGLPEALPLVGPYRGDLGNGGDLIQLLRPDNPQGPGPEEGYVPYLWVDAVQYGDAFPWPAEADGTGASLQRRRPRSYGDDPINWQAALPTAGRVNLASSSFTDTDRDGLPDEFETAYGFDPNSPGDGPLDPDRDGVANEQELLDGTNPILAASVWRSPIILSHPQSQSVEPGIPVTLSVSATGTAPLQYQWRLHGRVLLQATAASLVLPYAGQADAGSYTVVVMNQAGFAVSDPATVQVNIPPRITQQPVGGVLLDEGSTFTLTVQATGTGLLQYQWYHNGLPLPGANGPALILANLQAEDSGQYFVRVTDEIASASSDTVQVTVDARPEVLIPPLAQSVVAGDTVTFSILTRGTLPMSYRWRRNFTTLTNVTLHSWVHFYTISNVQPAQAGNYTVILTNLAFSTPGVLSSNAVLTVLADTDQDGLPDTFETNNGFDPTNPADGFLDRDEDGVSNRDEYRSGTDLADPLSYLKIDALSAEPGGNRLRFLARTGRTYSIEYRDELIGSSWQTLQHVHARFQDEVIEVADRQPPSEGQRFYRLVTPKYR